MEIARSGLLSLCNRKQNREEFFERVGARETEKTSIDVKELRLRPVHDTTGDVGGAFSFSQQVSGGSENSGAIGLR